jgi:hypothetical protein
MVTIVKKIEKLTAQQEIEFVEYRNEWLNHGLSTEPAEFAVAEEAITRFYERVGSKRPTFHRLSSPNACALMAKKDGNVSNISNHLTKCFFGQHESYWVAYYSFAEKIGVKYSEDNSALLKDWASISKSINWWTPYDNDCYMSDRPIRIMYDNENRLHCENGLAVEYPDGWGICMWHGTRVPREWIMDKKSLTAKIALTWENIEQRRAACEILGWISIVNDLDGIVIDRDDDPEIGELIEVNIPEIGNEKFLVVRCGTGRTFALPVPPNMKTALQANSWTFGIDNVNEFLKPEIRT